MKKALIVVVALAVVGGGAAFVPVGGDDGREAGPTETGPAMDLSSFSDAAPGQPLDLLFIHHSVGGTLLADDGPEAGEHAPQCIWESHPNGGGLRSSLTKAGYTVHEASYGSEVGEHTDLFDWLPKFRSEMDDVLRVRLQDEHLQGDERNEIVVFKSCFPNSDFVGEGEGDGNPAGPELTLANARASMMALRDVFARHPDVLFVYLTAPPQAPPQSMPLWKWLAKSLLGRLEDPVHQRRAAALARRFNNWLRDPDGWLSGYEHRNVVVFDYYDVLTNHSQSNSLVYPTGGGSDSHPSAEGNRLAAEELVPFLNRAVRRAGLLDAVRLPGAATSEATPAAPRDADAGPAVSADGGAPSGDAG